MPRVDPRRLGPPKEGCGASHSPRKEGKNPTGWSNTPPTHGHREPQAIIMKLTDSCVAVGGKCCHPPSQDSGTTPTTPKAGGNHVQSPA
ncbi:hypothetical protein Pcinc_037107 [Petrolisthes cinctipes]|uniref:Uncharacterized protein n=1 Tax=Petrolisthes cinctipes TaxID=88211 RepID=A0AAE1BU76_PETCI|nr:hypothetical protein Pcinc_037107 [Petrolisthes cinctipes]